MDAQQELFTALKLGIEAKGYTVYDGVLPPDGTRYPFVYMGDFRQTDKGHKAALTGTVYPAIHVWHNNTRRRGTISNILLDIKAVCRSVSHTSNFAWLIRNVNSQIIPDNTTKTPLLHGIVELEGLFS